MAALLPQQRTQGMRGLVGQSMAAAQAQTSFPLQPETLAYCKGGARPTFGWFNALNSFIYRLKQSNSWAAIYSGYLLCAEGEGLALSDLKGRTNYAATKAGAALTFTPGAGYGGGFDGSSFLDFPNTSKAALGGAGGLIFAGLLSATNAALGPSAALISDSGAPTQQKTALDWSGAGFIRTGPNLMVGDGPLIGGDNATVAMVGGGGPLGSGGAIASSWSGYRTGSTNVSGTLTRFSAFIVFPTGVGDSTFQAVNAALVTFLYDVSALS